MDHLRARNGEFMLQVVSLYSFVSIPKPYLVKARLGDFSASYDVKGTLIIAPEGVNGTLSGRRSDLEALLFRLGELLGSPIKNAKWSSAPSHPFGKLKFPLKAEVVTMGEVNPSPAHRVGTYVKPEVWNDLIEDPSVLLIDTRNNYETALGTFSGAVDPNTKAFRDFQGWAREKLKDKRRPIAMFCTGGIRCEKATSFLLEEGFETVYHLEGGILNYLETVPAAESMWQGECFVFDERVSLKHGLELGSAAMCTACGRPVSEGRNLGEVQSCPYCGADFDVENQLPD